MTLTYMTYPRVAKIRGIKSSLQYLNGRSSVNNQHLKLNLNFLSLNLQISTNDYFLFFIPKRSFVSKTLAVDAILKNFGNVRYFLDCENTCDQGLKHFLKIYTAHSKKKRHLLISQNETPLLMQ